MNILWNDKDFDFFFICLSVFHFHFFLKDELLHSAYKFLENLDEERPYLIVQLSKNGHFLNGQKLVIKTFENIKSFKDIDIIPQDDQPSKFACGSFKDFIGK